MAGHAAIGHVRIHEVVVEPDRLHEDLADFLATGRTARGQVVEQRNVEGDTLHARAEHLVKSLGVLEALFEGSQSLLRLGLAGVKLFDVLLDRAKFVFEIFLFRLQVAENFGGLVIRLFDGDRPGVVLAVQGPSLFIVEEANLHLCIAVAEGEGNTL